MPKGKSETRFTTARGKTDRQAHTCRYRWAGKRAQTGLHTYAGGDDDDERIRPCDEDGPYRYYCLVQSELDLAAVTPDSEHVLVEDGPELALSGLGIWDAGRRSLGEEEWRRGVRACLVRRWHYCGWLGSMIVVGGEIIETNVEANGAHADRRAVVSLRDAEAQRVLGMRLCSARVIVIWSRRAAECSSSRSPSRRTVHRIAG